VIVVTVATQLQQAISGVQSAAASMKTFSLETEDKQAKQTFQQLSTQLDNAYNTLLQRQQYIEQQEPQYKN